MSENAWVRQNAYTTDDGYAFMSYWSLRKRMHEANAFLGKPLADCIASSIITQSQHVVSLRRLSSPSS
jgi:hypothetical protein